MSPCVAAACNHSGQFLSPVLGFGKWEIRQLRNLSDRRKINLSFFQAATEESQLEQQTSQ